MLGVLGRGGMGTVYHCREEALQKDWAVKELIPPEGSTTREMVDQFRSEARLLARLDHPGLPRVATFFEENGRYYLVMDRICGSTLARRLEDGPPVRVDQAAAWLDTILDILGYLHGQDPCILFRDVSPANIMLDAAGAAHLIDFGLARCFAPDQGTRPALRGYGSSGYAPPEQYGQATTDVRSDLYAVAATAWHLFTGQPPVDAVERLMDPTRLAAPRILNPSLPPGLSAWVMRGMALLPEDRFSSAEAMRDALGQAIRVRPPAPVLAQPVELFAEQFAGRLEQRLRPYRWSVVARPPEPFSAAFTRQHGLTRCTAYLHAVPRLTEEETEAFAALASQQVQRLPLLMPSLSVFILLGLDIANPHAVQAAAARASSLSRGPRALLILPVDAERGESLDGHTPHAFTNSNDLGDLVLNVRIAARAAAGAPTPDE